MIQASSEQLITIDELRARMPDLRAREACLRAQLDALDAQAADRDAYLKLAAGLEGFLAQLGGSAATARTEDRRRVLRLLVKDVLIGPEKITIRHRIRSGNRPRAAATTTQPTRRVACAKVMNCVGGVVSPVLANLFMHYAFDKWLDREFPLLAHPPAHRHGTGGPGLPQQELVPSTACTAPTHGQPEVLPHRASTARRFPAPPPRTARRRSSRRSV